MLDFALKRFSSKRLTQGNGICKINQHRWLSTVKSCWGIWTLTLSKQLPRVASNFLSLVSGIPEEGYRNTRQDIYQANPGELESHKYNWRRYFQGVMLNLLQFVLHQWTAGTCQSVFPSGWGILARLGYSGRCWRWVYHHGFQWSINSNLNGN